MQATLPSGFANVDHSIASMDVGEGGWTVPWAMYHDDKRKLWLNGAYTISSEPGGTVQMYIRRDDNGWHVDASKCEKDQQWGRSGYVGNVPPVPVATFTV